MSARASVALEPRPPAGRGKPTVLVLRILDVLVWVAAIALGTLVRFGVGPPRRTRVGTAVLAGLAAALVLGVGYATGVHRKRYVIGSSDEAVALGLTSLVIGSSLDFTSLVTRPQLVPLGVVAFAPFVAAVGAVSPRLAYRWAAIRRRGPDRSRCRRLIVFGAGDAGRRIVRALLCERTSNLVPVALLDDDPHKAHLSVWGVRVLGDRSSLAEVAAALHADTLLVAVPSAEPPLKQQLALDAARCRLDLRILPPVSELIESTLGVTDIREVSESDLLGRPQVALDLDLIASYLDDRCVVVTGAGGSIGSEISRQIQRFSLRRLVLLDRDESALHAVQLSLEGRALLTDDSVIVGDIRDRDRVREVFDEVCPDVVFHAAALKHLPLLELYPDEALKTNVWGTWNLLEAARDVGCGHFVNISTDKAADPVSVLGYSKRLAERLTASMARPGGGVYLSVRFGNVLGSRGSVLPTFRAQIEAGGPVTVTDPEVTRFFMTTEEAVLLTVQAGAIGDTGEVLVLDMGSPVRIDDVARRLIARSGKHVEIEYTGLRRGEKLHECLLGTNEQGTAKVHPMILHTRVAPVDADALRRLGPATLAEVAMDRPTTDPSGLVAKVAS